MGQRIIIEQLYPWESPEAPPQGTIKAYIRTASPDQLEIWNSTGKTTSFYSSGSTGSDVSVSSGSYNSSNGELTLTKSDASTVVVAGITVSVDMDRYITGGTFNQGSSSILFADNSGSTFSVTGVSGSDQFITGGSYSSEVVTLNDNSGNTVMITGVTDTAITGGTYGVSNGSIRFEDNQGQSFEVSGINSENRYVSGGSFVESASTISFSDTSGGTFNVTGITSQNDFISGGSLSNGELVLSGSQGVLNISGFSATTNTLARYATRRTYNETSPQAPTSSTPVNMDFSLGSVVFNTNDFTLSGDNSNITCGKAGDYVINLQIVAEDAGGTASRLIVDLFVNDTLVQRSNNTQDTGGIDCSITSPITLASGDNIRVELSTSDSETINIHGYDLFIEELPLGSLVDSGAVEVTQLHKARLRMAAAVATVTGDNDLALDTEDYDTGNIASAGIVTIKNAGSYLISARGGTLIASNNTQVYIKLNGTKVVRARHSQASQGDQDTLHVSTVMELAAGDTVQMGIYTNGAHSTNSTLEDQCALEVTQLPVYSVTTPNTVAVDDQGASGYYDIGTVRHQWGIVNDGDTDLDVVVTLPAAFANTSYSVVATTSTSGQEYAVSCVQTSTTTFTLNRNDSVDGAANWNWIAIGLVP